MNGIQKTVYLSIIDLEQAIRDGKYGIGDDFDGGKFRDDMYNLGEEMSQWPFFISENQRDAYLDKLVERGHSVRATTTPIAEIDLDSALIIGFRSAKSDVLYAIESG